MDRQRWGMARDLFETAVELSPSAWDAWLLRECADSELRGEVRAMLEADLRTSESPMLPGRVSEFVAEYAPRAAGSRPRQG